MSHAVTELESELRQGGDPARAEAQRAYFKLDMQYLGTTLPETRAKVRAWLKAQQVTERDDVWAVATQLWSADAFQFRQAAVEVLDARRRVLGASDLADVEQLLRTSHTWALVDPLATNVVWAIASQDADGLPLPGDVLDRWAGDEDFWIRRSALLSQLRVVRPVDGDPTRFFGYADEMLDEREFFIRKAIGWVLRDMGRRRPDEVAAWVLPRAGRLSGVTRREVLKVLSDDQRQELSATRQPH